MANQEIINIIAAGNSVKDMDVHEICRRSYTIGVNGAAIHAPVDIGISMDRKWAAGYYEQIKGKKFLLRRPPGEWPEMFRFSCDHETDIFTEVPGRLNGRSSGHCALNLAFQMRPKKIYLFGFDFTGKAYWYGAYPWSKHEHVTRVDSTWVDACQKGIKQIQAANIEVIIVGETVIKNVNKISYKEYLKCT